MEQKDLTIKKCPFCNDDAIMSYSFDGEYASAKIYCQKCHAGMTKCKRFNIRSYAESQVNPGKVFYDLEEEIINAWNTRYVEKNVLY